MPLPASLLPLVRTRRFWTDWFWDTDTAEGGYPGLEDCTVRLPVAGGLGLTLSLSKTLSYFSLDFTASGEEPVTIGWDDQAHWHPHVLRWAELELICRAIALQDPGLPHPGLPLLLLSRFAPICASDDLELILPMLERAWRQLGIFSEAEIRAFIERGDARDDGFRWRCDAGVRGWCLEQEERERASRELYTLRRVENPEFPFEAWETMLVEAQRLLEGPRGAAREEAAAFAETGNMALVVQIAHVLRLQDHGAVADALGQEPPVERACWIVEVLLGLEPGTVVKRHGRAAVGLRPRHSLCLDLPLQDARHPLPGPAGKLIADTLHRILTDRGMGRADVGGSSSTQDSSGDYVTTAYTLYVSFKGDPEQAARLVRDVLWWAGAPESVRLRRIRGEEYPLRMETEEPAEELCLQVSQLRTARWDFFGKSGHRFDRVPLDRAAREALRAVLADVGAVGPDEDGWFTAVLPDGGSARFCFRRIDDDPDLDGGTVLIPSLSPGAADLLYRVLAVGGLILLPLAVATSEAEAATVTAPWPEVKVLGSASELYDILKRGPYGWWRDRRESGAGPLSDL